MRSRTGTW